MGSLYFQQVGESAFRSISKLNNLNRWGFDTVVIRSDRLRLAGSSRSILEDSQFDVGSDTAPPVSQERVIAPGIAPALHWRNASCGQNPRRRRVFDKVPEVVFGYDRAMDRRCRGEGGLHLI